MKLKYVAYADKKAADGTTVRYFYYRRPGQPSIQLGTDPATVTARWKVLQGQYEAEQRAAVRPAGSLGDLISIFYESAEWRDLAQNTQALWRISFRTLEDKFGDLPPNAIPLHVAQKWKEQLI
jgi:hypothetical protein